jgi:hypothetical protein
MTMNEQYGKTGAAYIEMYAAVQAASDAARGPHAAMRAMDEAAKPYGKEFLVAANNWAAMNRRAVPEQARMAVSCLIDEI